MRYALTFVVILSGYIDTIIAMEYTGLCGGLFEGWVASDSKCYQLIKTYASHSEASSVCKALDPLADTVIIRSSLEQAFITNYIYNELSDVSRVWIGLSRKNSETFIWRDGSDITFRNWAIGYPSDTIGRDCVEMVSMLSRESLLDGQWRDTSCQNGNMVLCEKLQSWSELELQKRIMRLEENPIPIGFIYVQLKDQPEPLTTWPMVSWTDISEEYEGLFFRVVGGNAAAFGDIQVENAPRLSEVRRTSDSCNSSPQIISPGVWSTCILSGGSEDGDTVGLSFYVNDTETKPTNTAMRIWKRTG